jgi:excinuclease ABC subunit C
MYDAGGTVIYVGRQKILKTLQLFSQQPGSVKTEALVSLIQNIDVTVTHRDGSAA